MKNVKIQIQALSNCEYGYKRKYGDCVGKKITDKDRYISEGISYNYLQNNNNFLYLNSIAHISINLVCIVVL
jgi:hypothetical protein